MNNIYLDNTGYENATPKSWDNVQTLEEVKFNSLSKADQQLVIETAEDADWTIDEAIFQLTEIGEISPLV